MGNGGIGWVEPDWPYGHLLRALTTTRVGGFSTGPWTSFNVGEHVGDDPGHVRANRAHLAELLGGLPIQWLDQVHGVRVVEAGSETRPRADAVWTAAAGQVLAVMTADCLPIVLGNRAGSLVAVVHGGWRGLVDGIIHETLAALPSSAEFAWLGPAIGADVYEVGENVLGRVRDAGAEFESAMLDSPLPGKGYLDLVRLAELQLEALGVSEVYRSGLSTWDTRLFYSHRKEAGGGEGQTGRMATLAWLPPPRGR
jgi:YfiH family protein